MDGFVAFSDGVKGLSSFSHNFHFNAINTICIIITIVCYCWQPYFCGEQVWALVHNFEHCFYLCLCLLFFFLISFLFRFVCFGFMVLTTFVPILTNLLGCADLEA